MIGFGPELEHWNDIMCTDCAFEKGCCRTCGISLKLHKKLDEKLDKKLDEKLDKKLDEKLNKK